MLLTRARTRTQMTSVAATSKPTSKSGDKRKAGAGSGGKVAAKKGKKEAAEKKEVTIDDLRAKYLNWEVEDFVIYVQYGRPKVGRRRKRKDGTYVSVEKYTKNNVDPAVLSMPPMRMLGRAKIAGEGDFMDARDDPNHEPKRPQAARSYGVAPESLRTVEVDALTAQVRDEVVEKLGKLNEYLLGLMFDCEAEDLKAAQDAVRDIAAYTLMGSLKCTSADQVMAKARKDKELAKKIDAAARDLFVANCKKRPFFLNDEMEAEGKGRVMYVRQKVWTKEEKYTGPKKSKGPDGPSKEELPSTPENWMRIVDEMGKLGYSYRYAEYTSAAPMKLPNGKMTYDIKPNKIKFKYKGKEHLIDNPFFNPACEFKNGKRASSLVMQKILLGAQTGSKGSTKQYGIVPYLASPIKIVAREEVGNEEEEVLGNYQGYDEANDADEEVIDMTSGAAVAAKAAAGADESGAQAVDVDPAATEEAAEADGGEKEVADGDKREDEEQEEEEQEVGADQVDEDVEEDEAEASDDAEQEYGGYDDEEISE